MEIQTNNNSNKTSAIERALAAAKARKAAKEASTETQPQTEKTSSEVVKAKPARPDVATAAAKRQEERAARAASKAEKVAAEAAAKAEKVAARAAAKAAKLEARAAAVGARKQTHMKKVERVRSKLPGLGEVAARLYTEATTNLSIEQMDALAQHVAVQSRALRTARAYAQKPLALGATVRITAGDPKFIGQTGTVVHSHRLHAKVDVGGRRPVYIYTGEAEPVEASANVAAE